MKILSPDSKRSRSKAFRKIENKSKSFGDPRIFLVKIFRPFQIINFQFLIKDQIRFPFQICVLAKLITKQFDSLGVSKITKSFFLMQMPVGKMMVGDSLVSVVFCNGIERFRFRK